MSTDPVVADVRVREHRGGRVTTITVVERGTGQHWPARATSIPPIVRERLAAWLEQAPPCPHQQDGEPHGIDMVSGGGSHLEQSLEPPGVDAGTRVGFTPQAGRPPGSSR